MMADFIPDSEGQERPSLHFNCAATGEQVNCFFGYFEGVPTMAVNFGEAENMVMFPRALLIQALEEGWGDQETGHWVEVSKY